MGKSPVGWRLARLDELGTVQRGRSRHRPRNDPSLYGGQHPFVQTGDVKAAGLKLRRYSQTYSDVGLAQSRLWPPGTLCITIAANICDTTILDIPACFPDSIVGFTPKREVADVVFVKYALDHAKQRFTGISRGATQDNLSLEKLLSQHLPVPRLEDQRYIASILEAYDELIEVNRRRIALLEEIARRLFDEWFVHFRFPGHEACAMIETEGRSVPQGWQRSPISTLYQGLYDGPHATPKPSKTGPAFLGIGNITESGQLDLTDVRHISEDEYPNWTRRVIPQAGDIVFTYEATLNRYALIPRDIKCCLGRRLALIRMGPTSKYRYFLFLNFFSTDWRDVITRNTLSGATVDRIPLSKFPEFPITVPPENIVADFNRIVQPVFEQISNLHFANINLHTQRDFLLPKLISGQVSTSTTIAELEAVA